MRKTLYWLGVVVALATIAGGGWYAYAEYRATSGPGAAVRGYFAAVSRGDAPAALAYGNLPDGPHDLLTSDVLGQQQELAPLHDVHIVDVDEAGDEATVRFSYRLQFPNDDQEISGSVHVNDGGSGWRLAQAAVATTLQIDEATDRLTLAGAAVPAGRTLMFPGAIPLHFDTANLQVDPASAGVQFGGAATTVVHLQPTAGARAALVKSVTARLAACLTAGASAAACPPPPTRVVPGSLRGSIDGLVSPHLTFSVGTTASGLIEVQGRVPFRGRYSSLSYANVVTPHRGSLSLNIDAIAPASGPLAVQFVGTQS